MSEHTTERGPCCPLADRCAREGYCISEDIADLMGDPHSRPEVRCEGSGSRSAPLYVHGCYADLDGTACDDPDDHAYRPGGSPEDSAHYLLGSSCICGEWTAGCGQDVVEQYAAHVANSRPSRPGETDGDPA